jgi:hypothetical protein
MQTPTWGVAMMFVSSVIGAWLLGMELRSRGVM